MIAGGFLAPEERGFLQGIVRRPSERHGIARRANALLLLDDGLSCIEVARVLYLDDDTVRAWHEAYAADGPKALSAFGWKGGQAKLDAAQEAELAEALAAKIFPSTAAVIAHIATHYGTSYSKAGVIKLLHRLGFVYAKPKALPGKADVAAQQAFIAAYERLLNGLADDEAVYFADAVHPEYQSRPAYGWFRRGDKPAVRQAHGRQRMNLEAALCLDNFDCQVVESLQITAESTIALFEKLERRNPDKRWIYVILDNAPTHRNRYVTDWLNRHGCRIKPIFLPPYAPNLNAIEALWKLLHEYVTNNRYYESFRDFANAVWGFFQITLPQNWQRFRDRVTDNFHIIRPEEFRVVG